MRASYIALIGAASLVAGCADYAPPSGGGSPQYAACYPLAAGRAICLVPPPPVPAVAPSPPNKEPADSTPGEVYPLWANAEWERIMRGEARLVPDSAYAPPVPPIPPRPPIADNSAPQQLPDAGQPDTRDDAAPEPTPRRQPPVTERAPQPDPPQPIPDPARRPPQHAPSHDVEAGGSGSRSAPPSSPAEPCNSWWDPCWLWNKGRGSWQTMH